MKNLLLSVLLLLGLNSYSQDFETRVETIVINYDDAILQNRIICNQANKNSTLGGTIDPSKEYFIDGVIDLDTMKIRVPVGGIELKGYSFATSGLISSEDSYTMFICDGVAGCGDFNAANFYISTTGTGSKVFELIDSDGTHAFEFSMINYIGCSSLGVIDHYRQGLEVGTGRFGGSPSLELKGAWSGGYRITTSIVRGLDVGMTGSLFEAGVGFVMQSRFLTDLNVDLPTSAGLLDFSDTNFPNPSTLELRDAIITRNTLFVPNDANITPNITASNLSCSWKDNNGIPNTFVGGTATITTEVLTTVTTVNVPVTLAGTVTNSDLQHFDVPANGQLRHLGNNPKEYTVNFDFILEGGSGDDYEIQLIKDDGGLTAVRYSQLRVINNLAGGRDVGFYNGLANITLNKDDFIYWEVVNKTDNSDCTLELGSSWSVGER